MAEETYTDEQLLELFQAESTRSMAFNQLMKKYQRRVYQHVRRMVIHHEDADDVLQNTFIKVWHHLGDFRGGSQLYTWLYRIATNEALTFLYKQRRKFFLPLVDVERKLSQELETDPLFNGDAIQLKLQQAILTLPEKQRVVFNLKYFDEMKYEDMSEVLGTSVGALKASYHHAVKKIEAFLLNR